LLLGLPFDPAADDLLLARNVRHQALDASASWPWRGGALGGAARGHASGGPAGISRARGFPEASATGARWPPADLGGGPTAAALIDEIGVEVGDRRQPVSRSL